jgi:hypothetical protein
MVNGCVADLLDESGSGRSGEFFGEGFAFFFMALKANLDQLVASEERVELGEELR